MDKGWRLVSALYALVAYTEGGGACLRSLGHGHGDAWKRRRQKRDIYLKYATAKTALGTKALIPPDVL